MNKPDKREFIIKEKRMHDFMKDQGYEAIIIGTQANFSWISGGGDSHVVTSSDMGEAILVLTGDKKVCIANTMDARRIFEQELDGLDFELISLKWFETPKDIYAANMIKGMKTLSDFPVEGAECDFKKFYKLHYPLTEPEIERYRVLGREAEKILWDVSNRIKPGMTGSDVESLLICEYAKKKISVPCMIIGVDEEISSWRHPIPWNKEIKKCLMLVLGVKRNGLVVPITRMVHFGDISEDMRKRFDAVCTIAADTILSCKAGVKFTDVSKRQKALYKELGFEDEWEKHFVGGITGYVVSDGSLCTNKDAVMTESMTFNWYVTITGVNTEDTLIITKYGYELFTVNDIWPTREIVAEKGTVKIPDIFIVK